MLSFVNHFFYFLCHETKANMVMQLFASLVRTTRFLFVSLFVIFFGGGGGGGRGKVKKLESHII